MVPMSGLIPIFTSLIAKEVFSSAKIISHEARRSIAPPIQIPYTLHITGTLHLSIAIRLFYINSRIASYLRAFLAGSNCSLMIISSDFRFKPREKFFVDA